MQPKQPSHPNVKTMPRALRNEDLDIVLTFGWFGGAFLSMCAQKIGHFGRSEIDFLQM